MLVLTLMSSIIVNEVHSARKNGIFWDASSYMKLRKLMTELASCDRKSCALNVVISISEVTGQDHIGVIGKGKDQKRGVQNRVACLLLHYANVMMIMHN